MKNDYTGNKFKELLDKLQQESWQLELLISGFAIFGLFSAYDPIKTAAMEAANSQIIYKVIITQIGFVACIILIFNLLLHVLLRGLWIGALGLRYVSGDIDYDELNYSNKFSNYLKKRVGSFDQYINSLENYCSIIFAVSFLLIFYVLALTFSILAITLSVEYVLENESLPGWLRKTIGIPLLIFMCLGMFLTFIDFLTQGWFKKKKWLSKIYFPFYWVFSIITLSFLYRPIVYNFLDDKFGRRISFMLFPFIILFTVVSSTNYTFSNYFSENDAANSFVTNDNNYEDLSIKNGKLVNDVAIQSKVITDSYIKVFIKFSKSIEDNIFDFNDGLKPETDIRGISSDIEIGIKMATQNTAKIDSLKLEYLKTFNEIYSVEIDSVKFNTDFVVNKDKLGFEAYLSAASINSGKHILNVKYRSLKKQDTINKKLESIIFWYYPKY